VPGGPNGKVPSRPPIPQTPGARMSTRTIAIAAFVIAAIVLILLLM
jgi:hypothetical protein